MGKKRKREEQPEAKKPEVDERFSVIDEDVSDEEQEKDNNQLIEDQASKELEPMEEEGDVEEETKGKRKKKRKVLTEDELSRWNKKQDRRGVIYISRIPMGMNLTKLRQVLSTYGELDRIYLTPIADPKQKRKASNRKRYQDGWVEFKDKRVAKRTAGMLNTRPIGGSRKTQYYDELWNMKYLSGFKWTHLTEKIAYDNAVREQKLRAEISQMKKENTAYVTRAEKSFTKRQIEKRKEKSGKKLKESDSTKEESGSGRSFQFPQHTVVGAEPKPLPKSVLQGLSG